MRQIKKVTFVSVFILLLFPSFVIYSQSAIFEQNKENVIYFTCFGENKEVISKGTGFLVDKEILATTYHLVSKAKDVEGRNFKDKKVKFEGIVAIDKNFDFALIKVKQKQPGLFLGNSDELGMGKRVFSIGGNESGEITIFEGEVTNILEISSGQRVVEVSLAVPDTFSGAPLLDSDGKVLGILVAFEGGKKIVIPINFMKNIQPKSTPSKFKNLQPEDYFLTFEGASLAGRVFAAMDETGRAQRYLERALKQKPDDIEILTFLASVYTEQRNYSSAVSTYKKIIDLQPTRDDILMKLGLIHLKMMKWEDAVPYFENAYQVNMDNKHAYYYIGNAYEEMRKFDMAAEAYEKYLRLNPDDPRDTASRLAICLLEVQNYEGAIVAFKDAIKIDSKNLKLHENLAVAYKKVSKYDEAAEIYNSLAQMDPERANQYYNTIIQMYDEAKLPDKAIEAAKKMVELNPNSDTAVYNLGYMYVKLEKYKEAIEAFKKVTDIRPDYEWAYYNLGFCYNKLKKYKDSIEVFKKFAELAPENADAWFNIGVGYMLQKKFSSAVEPLKKAIELNPAYALAYYNLAITYLNLQDRYSAQEIYKKLSSIDPDLAQKLKKVLY